MYPCTSRTLNFFFALLFYSYCIYSHSALYIFFKLLRPLHCCTVCFVLCYVMYILCKHIESHFTSPSHIPCLCKLTWPIKPEKYYSMSKSLITPSPLSGFIAVSQSRFTK